MGWERVRDSAIEQLVLAREKASVAAAKREISVVLAGGEDGGVGFGFKVAVGNVCSGGGVEGGDG